MFQTSFSICLASQLLQSLQSTPLHSLSEKVPSHSLSPIFVFSPSFSPLLQCCFSNLNYEAKKREKKSLLLLIVLPVLFNTIFHAKDGGELIAKIARVDWPNKWKNLFETLTNFLKSEFDFKLRGAIILKNVLSELSSKRLRKDQEEFQLIGQPLFTQLSSFWFELVNSSLFSLSSLLSSLQQQQQQQQQHSSQIQIQQIESIENSLLLSLNILKVLKQLASYSFDTIHDKPPLLLFFNKIVSLFPNLLQSRKKKTQRLFTFFLKFCFEKS